VSTRDDPLHSGSEPETDGAVVPFARRAPRISQPDVFRAADELLIEGHRPTIDRVRMKLGRGSPNTINDHLDAWWAKLGSRLRDLPGQEFPQVPERIGKVLQLLWTEAVNGAHEVLQGSLAEREQSLQERAQQVSNQAAALDEKQRTNTARATALEDNLTLAREQLGIANRRAEHLERTLTARDTELAQLQQRLDTQTRELADLTAQQSTEREAHRAERVQMEERHAATEARWLREVDRAREAAKSAEQALRKARTPGSTLLEVAPRKRVRPATRAHPPARPKASMTAELPADLKARAIERSRRSRTKPTPPRSRSRKTSAT
jgi:hypothetical protein